LGTTGVPTFFLLFKGKPYTQFEKMFMMFDFYVWMMIIFTFVGAWLIIQIINFCSDKVQDLVFGEGIRTPTMNFFAAIFGLGQTTLPQKSFARFLLMMFTILCLILRTCHQSLLYTLMQAEIRKAELQTIDEAIEKGYTFHIATTNAFTYEVSGLMKRSVEFEVELILIFVYSTFLFEEEKSFNMISNLNIAWQ
jgi:hypothetical protein